MHLSVRSLEFVILVIEIAQLVSSWLVGDIMLRRGCDLIQRYLLILRDGFYDLKWLIQHAKSHSLGFCGNIESHW